jgi:hypothetical protein
LSSWVLFISNKYDEGARFFRKGIGVYFWTSTEYYHKLFGNEQAYMRSIFKHKKFDIYYHNLGRFVLDKYYGLSVRCIKD